MGQNKNVLWSKYKFLTLCYSQRTASAGYCTYYMLGNMWAREL